jgi:hypothetical protein
MDQEGPPLELLLRRIGETPPDFLSVPAGVGQSGVHVAAVANDLVEMLSGRTDSAALMSIKPGDVPASRITLLLCWLLADEWFRAQRFEPSRILSLLTTDAQEAARHTAPEKFVYDAERREELARLTLARLGFRPSGESVLQARDRFTSLSAAERARVLAASRAAEERARAIREALARKAAEESADKWTRE